jgi:tRNA threonylcarbamoyladenosine biosynthesis protein TsaB
LNVIACVLALDSTTRAGSVALVENGEVVDERLGDSSRSHGERLPSDLEALGVAWSSIDVFGVCVGPGSFIGLRIGIATMQGLALVTGTRLIGISALDALAHRDPARRHRPAGGGVDRAARRSVLRSVSRDGRPHLSRQDAW